MLSRQTAVGHYALLVALLGLGFGNIILFVLFIIGVAQVTLLYFLVLIMSVVVVYADARAINRAKGRAVVGAGNWAVLVWFFWIIAMPLYVFSRRRNAISAPTGLNGASQDALEAIRKLGELKERGVVTEDEFQRKKQELLSRV